MIRYTFKRFYFASPKAFINVKYDKINVVPLGNAPEVLSSRSPVKETLQNSTTNSSAAEDRLASLPSEIASAAAATAGPNGNSVSTQNRITHNLTQLLDNASQSPEYFLKQALLQIDFKLDFYRKTRQAIDHQQYQLLKNWINWIHKRKTVLISIDLEVHELRQKTPLEVGVSILDFRNQSHSLFPNILNLHFVIQEHKKVINTKYVPNNKFRFINGSSYVIKKKELGPILEEILNHYGYKEITANGKASSTSPTSSSEYDFDNPPPLAVVGHFFTADVNFLALGFGIKLDPKLPVIDTGSIWRMTFEKSLMVKSNLTYILRKLNIPGVYLHNGANDSYYTLILLLKMVDPQLRVNLYCKNYKKLYDYDNWLRLNDLLNPLLEKPKQQTNADKVVEQEPVEEIISENVEIDFGEITTTTIKRVSAASGTPPENQNKNDNVNSSSLTPEDNFIFSELLKLRSQHSKKLKVAFKNSSNPLVQNKNLINEQYSFNIYDDELQRLQKVKGAVSRKDQQFPPHNEFMGPLEISKTKVFEKLENYWANDSNDKN